MPAKLLKHAKVSEDSVRATALAQVPGGEVVAGELEREHGHLIFSYDIKVAGESGIEEIAVDAVSGKVLSKSHEGPKAERRERAQEKQEAKKATAAPQAREAPGGK